MEYNCYICKGKIKDGESFGVTKILGVTKAHHFSCYKEDGNILISLSRQTAKDLRNLLRKLYPYPKDTDYVWETLNELNRIL